MRTILLGLDAFDPGVFERLYNRGLMPNLAKYVQTNRYAHFQISNPAQSEISWTSIATGLNPGEHGIFDFVHRDPETYGLGVSMLPSRAGLGGTQFVRPSTAQTIFDRAAERGYPATTLWWPVTFPARLESPVRTLPGLGTPDIQGRLGVGQMFTSDSDLVLVKGKTPVEALARKSRYTQAAEGPKSRPAGTCSRATFLLK
jgi:predicted AlkP superfamily phosphohydrolase/phosphomutase